MIKLSSTQLFILAILALAILAATAYLDPSYRPLLVVVVLGVLTAAGLYHASATGAAHVVTGINLGVPLMAPEGQSVPAQPAPLSGMEAAG